MLYLPELLKFQTAFGKLWIAGQSKANIKKKPFNKELIKNADINELVNSVFNVDVPLAPRVSGTFLCGVCAIYQQKLHYFELDVMALFRKIHSTLKTDDREGREIVSSTRKRQRKRKGREIAAIASLPDEMADILNDMELNDVTQLSLEQLQQEEEDQTDNLQSILRSQLCYDDDGELMTPPPKKRTRSEELAQAPAGSASVGDSAIALYPRPGDDDLFMDEDDLFAQLHDEANNEPKISEATPPPLDNNFETCLNSSVAGDGDALALSPIREPPITSRKQQRIKNNLYSELVVDKDVNLPGVMLAEWRLSRDAISCHRQQIECDDRFVDPKSFGRLGRLMSRLANADSRPVDHEDHALEEVFNPINEDAFLDIEQLRGDAQEIEAPADLTVGFQRETRNSLRTSVMSPSNIDSRSIRSSLADSFQHRWSVGDSDAPVNLSRRPSCLSSASNNENCWFDPIELKAAVAPNNSLVSFSMDTLQSSLVGGPLEVESNSTNTTMKKKDVSRNYSIESWRFKMYIEKAFEKEAASSGTENIQSIKFSRLVPPGTSRSTAARSFYQLLVLATFGDVEVEFVPPNDIIISKALNISSLASS